MSDGYEKSESLTKKFDGAYWYKGDGDWSEVYEVGFVPHEDGKAAEFRTRSTHYESVPHELREEAYDQYDGDNVVVVGVGGDE